MGVCLNAYPFTLCADEHAQATAQDSIYSSLAYTDFYRVTSKSETEGYLYRYRFSTGWKHFFQNGELSCELNKANLVGRISRLDKADDRIDFSMPNTSLWVDYTRNFRDLTLANRLDFSKDMGANIQLKHLSDSSSKEIGFAAKMGRAKIDYCVGSDRGNIPFYWVKTGAELAYRTASMDMELQLSQSNPYQDDEQFYNKLFVNEVSGKTEYRFTNNLSSSIAVHALQADASFYYKGEQYAKLDNARFASVKMALAKQDGRFCYNGGIDSYLCRLDEDSYFDIWPFTAWDLFLAHRTRIKSFTVDAVSPYLGLSYQTKERKSSGLWMGSSFSYHHVFHNEDVILRNRRIVLYPFLFTYDTQHYNWKDDLDAYLNLELNAGYNHSRVSTSISVKQLVPIQWSKISDIQSLEPSSETGSRTRQWGGTTLVLNLSMQF